MSSWSCGPIEVQAKEAENLDDIHPLIYDICEIYDIYIDIWYHSSYHLLIYRISIILICIKLDSLGGWIMSNHL